MGLPVIITGRALIFTARVSGLILGRDIIAVIGMGVAVEPHNFLGLYKNAAAVVTPRKIDFDSPMGPPP